jgi:hypothetical protein
MPASPGANRIYQVTAEPCSSSIPISVTAGPETHVVRLFGRPYIRMNIHLKTHASVENGARIEQEMN